MGLAPAQTHGSNTVHRCSDFSVDVPVKEPKITGTEITWHVGLLVQHVDSFTPLPKVTVIVK